MAGDQASDVERADSTEAPGAVYGDIQSAAGAFTGEHNQRQGGKTGRTVHEQTRARALVANQGVAEAAGRTALSVKGPEQTNLKT